MTGDGGDGGDGGDDGAFTCDGHVPSERWHGCKKCILSIKLKLQLSKVCRKYEKDNLSPTVRHFLAKYFGHRNKCYLLACSF